MKNSLTVSGLTKVYPPEKKGAKPFVAVNHVSFELHDGEILGLLGPNGAGKSTTISMLLGVLTPTNGKIEYFGKDFFEHRSEILETVTFSSTYISMPWRLSVMENLRVYGWMYGVMGKIFERRVQHYLEFFGVWDQRNKTMNQLSAGQVTRIMLAKAFIPHPKVVLLDEPTASLDPDIAHQVREFILRQQKEFKTSILYTSHNMDEVSVVCDRVVFLRNGKVVIIDTPSNLAKSVSLSRMHLTMKDGLKRTERFSKEMGLVSKVENREIEIELDEQKIAEFLLKLAAEGIKYEQISIDTPTLEDYFLSMSDQKQKL
ncbi:MAG: ABC transporter ATP-binding protein [Candidatus Pacebacteria bacterium CG10_big_fil_rev_8_21_14_0_10_44_11]|nr:MAG: ABC transporter ATP-binding protein [Candidatus Pacebacteria bacterium CG10_big_fil_rev_8_21_14_0_10_44_11]